MTVSQSSEGALLLDNIRISKQLEKSPKFKNQAKKLSDCCKYKNLFLGEDNSFIELGKRCGYRICPHCGKIRSYMYFKQFIGFLKTKKLIRYMQGKGLRFLTLTIKNVKNLSKGIDKFYDSFTKFKRRKYFKDNIFGGLGTLDIKKGNDGLWNLHGHFIINSKYLDMKSHKKTGKDSKLVSEWNHCTKGSGILYLEKVKGYEGSLGYVLKYLVKGILDLSPKEKAIFFKKTYKRRLLFTFGEFYGIKRPKIKSNLQYIKPGSEEYNLFYGSNENKPLNVSDYEKEV